MSQWKEWMRRSDAFAEEVLTLPCETYEVNPYVKVFPDEEVSGVYHIYYDAHMKGAAAWMNLIVGEEKALLIDTAFGVGDLKGLVEAITDKPVIVANTHFHGDHTLGNGQFDEIYIMEQDIPYLEKMYEAGEAARFYPAKGSYREEDLVPVKRTALHPMKDGEIIPLGPDHEVEVIHMPGHAPGGCMFFDHSSGYLYSGDAVLATPTLIIDRFPAPFYPELMTVEAFREGLTACQTRLSGVKKLFPGHGIQGVDPSYIQDYIDTCTACMEEPETHEFYDYVDDPAQSQIMCRGKAMIVYSDSRVRKPVRS